MPGTLKDASPLREIIEAMDVAFRGLKTSLGDLSRAEAAPRSPDRTPPSQPAHSSARAGPGSLLRQHSRLSFKGRRVSCKDLGQGDCQGWLHLKKEGRGLLHSDRWAKRWLVLYGHVLYGYKDKEAQQAETMIALPGYQVSPATDVRSKRHAFRVHNHERSVVFASDSQLDMTKWMNKMGLSAIAYDSAKAFTTGGFCRPERDGAHIEDMYFSDTDEEDGKKQIPLKRPQRVSRPAVTPSPTSSLDRARQKLRSWRAGSPAPSVGSLSSLSSLGSERPAVKKKPSLRFLARVRRDSGQSAGSATSAGSAGSQRRASQPEAGVRQKTLLAAQKSAPLSENDLQSLASPDTSLDASSPAGPESASPRASLETTAAAAAPAPAAAAPLVSAARRAATPPAVPSKPASVTAAAAAAKKAAPTVRQQGPVAVTARWLASPEDARRTSRPLSQPAAGRGPRPVPPPRRPRSRDQPPEYVNWRLPGSGTAAAAAGAPSPAGRHTETVIRIGGGGRVERIEERERRPAAARPSAESRRLSVQHRGVTPEGQIVASILSGTHTVPRPAAAFRRAASADAERPELPGYMRPTISSRRQSDARQRGADERRPPLQKQRSLSASGLAAAAAATAAPLAGRRRASLASEQPARPSSENGGAVARRPPPARPRGTTSEGPAARATVAPPSTASEERTREDHATRSIPEGPPGRTANGDSSPAAGTVPPPASVDACVGQSDERLLSPGGDRRTCPTDDVLPLKKTSMYECPGWSPMARHAEEARMRFAFEMDLDAGGDDVFEPAVRPARPLPPPRLAKSASASQVGGAPGRERPPITIQVQPDGGASGTDEPRTPRKPAMGVSMIGKQRRTPTSSSSSPHFVFPPAAPLSPAAAAAAETTGISRGIAHAAPPPPPPPPPLPPLAKSQTSPALGWGLRVLPRYGLQYPPVFTPDTYSLAQMSGAQMGRAESPAGAALAETADRSFADSATQTDVGRSPPGVTADAAVALMTPPGAGETSRS